MKRAQSGTSQVCSVRHGCRTAKPKARATRTNPFEPGAWGAISMRKKPEPAG